MNLSLLLIPVLAGYWFLTHTNLTWFQTVRQSGYHLFFNAAIAGGILLIAGRLITYFGNSILPSFQGLWHDFAPFNFSGTMAISSLFAWLTPSLINRLTPNDLLAENAAKRYGDLIDRTIHEALGKGSLVEITTRSGKSYIGFPQSVPVHVSGDGDLGLLPVLSGYRTSKSRRLVITTDYWPVYEASETRGSPVAHLSADDFRIVLPRREIVSARRFDLEAYKFFSDITWSSEEDNSPEPGDTSQNSTANASPIDENS